MYADINTFLLILSLLFIMGSIYYRQKILKTHKKLMDILHARQNLLEERQLHIENLVYTFRNKVEK